MNEQPYISHYVEDEWDRRREDKQIERYEYWEHKKKVNRWGE